MRRTLGLIALVGVAFFGFIGLGFATRGWFPQVSDTVFGTVLALVMITVIVAATCWLYGFELWEFIPVGRSRRGTPTRKILDRYDPGPTQTCEHLKPIEHAIREAGIVVEVSRYVPVQVECRINVDALRRQFNLPDWIYYQEGYMPEKSEFDNPWAEIVCGACLKTNRAGGAIRVLHPKECSSDTPWFPLAGS